jgi:hypothetical protein
MLRPTHNLTERDIPRAPEPERCTCLVNVPREDRPEAARWIQRNGHRFECVYWQPDTIEGGYAP